MYHYGREDFQLTSKEKEIMVVVIEEIEDVIINSIYEKSEKSCSKINLIIEKYIDEKASEKFRSFFCLLKNCLSAYHCTGRYRKRLDCINEAINLIVKEI